MEYDFRAIEKKWQAEWKKTNAYKVSNDSSKPACYVLDMFPYPSGVGLHVGHPLGYVASDIYSRYKRLKGFNVLHPMGFDSFGLPAEQYALETGQHPAVTTEKNIATYKEQLEKIGFGYDWSREVRTSDPAYYKWTQWIFLKLFNSYFCNTEKKAIPIPKLIEKYSTKGAMPKTGEPKPGVHFTADQWNAMDKAEQEEILMKRRLAFSAFGEVNWCEALGTVLANDEVVNGVSERGGHPVVKKKMRQWYLRITSYADRLLEGLETVNFSDAMKEMQRNWIGKSEGAELEFRLANPSPAGEGGKTPLETSDKKYWRTHKANSRENRKDDTVAENILWQRLRNNSLDSKVRRQHVIDNYIIDFAFLNEKILIEVDGGYHADEEQKKYDDARTQFLLDAGYSLIRFTNDEVIDHTDTVIEKIQGELKGSAPLSGRRGVGGEAIKVYTTRPDTIFGVDFLVLAPEHELVSKITTTEQKPAIDEYLTYVRSRSDRERQAEVKQITGCFTGAYAENPFNGKPIPVWIAEYVLAGYGTGAIMAVPCGDQRDFLFAKHFNIPITNIIGDFYTGEEANPTKEATLENSDFLNGMLMKDAIGVAINKIEEAGIGKRKVNYRMRDAGFSRQRYWGEPFPIIWKDGIAVPLNEKDLPLELPHVDKYGPGPEGEGPLANIEEWVNTPEGRRETSTMPGYAGSSWYFLRYMDPHNDEAFCDRKASDYWGQVDVYVGGTEHAVGHLLYSRMWTKVLFDLGLIGFDEPYKKLVNQGMITGKSYFLKGIGFQGYKLAEDIGSDEDYKTFYIVSSNKTQSELDFLNPKISYSEYWIRIKYGHRYVQSDGTLTKENFERYILENPNEYFGASSQLLNFKWDKPYGEEFILAREDVEKMSKSKFNVDNPDDIVDRYGADTFRMYEMFLGPVEQSKPWDTKGIEGVHRFLKKLWRLFFDETKGAVWTAVAPSPSGKAGDGASDAEFKTLHKTIKKIEQDTESFSYNTAVSAFMVCVNELAELKCHKKEVLENVLILLSPYAPHIAEELWQALGNVGSVLDAAYPKLEEKYLIETTKEYPVSINGKLRTSINLPAEITAEDAEKEVLANDIVQKWLEGKAPKKFIFVKGRMINLVI